MPFLGQRLIYIYGRYLVCLRFHQSKLEKKKNKERQAKLYAMALTLLCNAINHITHIQYYYIIFDFFSFQLHRFFVQTKHTIHPTED